MYFYVITDSLSSVSRLPAKMSWEYGLVPDYVYFFWLGNNANHNKRLNYAFLRRQQRSTIYGFPCCSIEFIYRIDEVFFGYIFYADISVLRLQIVWFTLFKQCKGLSNLNLSNSGEIGNIVGYAKYLVPILISKRILFMQF